MEKILIENKYGIVVYDPEVQNLNKITETEFNQIIAKLLIKNEILKQQKQQKQKSA
ncbi:hypothetical protein [Tuberibacillus calidus]|jgi:hypothetical protein|uniref:hypothetical protein n=1 Tax=Tuberibacillus calidus TaxID=340097 RepID=UPI000401CF2C|nr:hypothetical protein [Tuberibacillus calidus]